YKSGLRSINIGIESANPQALKGSKRNGVKREKELIEFCYYLGIKINAFFILGLLPDTKESIKETIHYAKSLKIFSAQFTINTPLPGTSFYEDIGHLLIDQNLENYDNNTLVFQHPNLTKKDYSVIFRLALY
ncbi:MAG: radical SAM protein, partial [Proteobacteria bacterium]|nr:radical SAM protein [Pseudomonadota bacterium]